MKTRYDGGKGVRVMTFHGFMCMAWCPGDPSSWLSKSQTRVLQQTWLQRQIVKLLRGPNFFINTVSLEVDSFEIQNAIAGGRESWEGRRPS